MSDTWRKVIFYGIAALLLAVKIFGLFKRNPPWYLIITLAAIGVLTEPLTTAASSIDQINPNTGGVK